jgi:hypothetical protein
MLTALIAALKAEFQTAHAKEIVWLSQCLIQYLDGAYTNDAATRNAALDSLSDFILTNKTAIAVTPEAPNGTPET